MENLSRSEAPRDEISIERYLTFGLAESDYAVQLDWVHEIVGLQRITPIPDMPAWWRGVINLRGNVIPLGDVRSRFQMEERPYDQRTCIIVVSIDSRKVGLIVDRVNEVADIQGDQVEKPSVTGGGGFSPYIKGIGKVEDEIKIILDVQKLLSSEEKLAIDALPSGAGGEEDAA